MIPAEERFQCMLDRLKERGWRLTPQRMSVLRVLAESDGHPSVEQIHARIVEEFPTTGLATVYKTVSLLKNEGEVLELGFSDRPSRYDGRIPDPHPHLVCTRCGEILDRDDVDLEEQGRRLAQETGWRLVNWRLEFFGLCPACRRDGERMVTEEDTENAIQRPEGETT